MKIWKVCLTLLAIMVFAGVVSAFEDSVERYPTGAYTDYWTAAYSTSDTIRYGSWSVSAIADPTGIDTSTLKLYATSSPKASAGYQYVSVRTNGGDYCFDQNYITFRLVSSYYGGIAQTTTDGLNMRLYEAGTATQLISIHLDTTPAGTRYELIKTGSYYDLYGDGVFITSVVNSAPGYDGDVDLYLQLVVRAYQPVSSEITISGYAYFDDISDSSVIGIPEIVTDSTANLSFTYGAQLMRNNPLSEYNIDLYSLTNPDNAGKLRTWNITGATNDWAYITDSRSTLMGSNYGLYLLEMTKDSVAIYDVYFYYDDLANPIGLPETLFMGSADVSTDIRDYANNGGVISPDGAVYLYADNGTDGFYPISYEILNTPNSFDATATCVYGSENINETEFTFSGLTNYYTVELDGNDIGNVSGPTFEYTVTDWTNYTAHIFSFSPDLTKPGVYGYIKDLSTRQGIHNAIVSINNETWSTNVATDETGMYYLTLGMIANETYTISASAAGYTASEDFATSTTAGATSRKDIYLDPVASISDGGGIYYAAHYVRFIVTDKYLFERYDANVTISGVNVTTTTQRTGSDGACGFQMTENIRYAVNTVYGSINQTDYIFPTENSYYIVLDATGTSLLPASQFYEVCNVTIVKNEVNSSHATITATYNDTGTGTNSVYFVLGQTYENNNTLNVMETSSVGAGNMTYVFTVRDYVGEDYVIKAVIDHDSFGAIEKYYGINFPGSTLPFAGNMMVALVVLVFFVVAMQWGKADAHTGAVLICGLGWWFYYLDIFERLGSATNTMIGVGLGLATVYAILGMINKKRDEGGI